MSSRFASSADTPPPSSKDPAGGPEGATRIQAKSLPNSDLESTPLQTGTAAKRLLAQDDALRMFHHDPRPRGLLGRLLRYGWPTLRYLTQTEVHTYAFWVAANAILSLCPLIVLLLTIIRRVFHSPQMYNVVLQQLHDYLPSNKDFVIRNLQFLASVRGRSQALSFVMLLITSTGIFLPLEVALNSIWGFKKNRSYVMNGIVALLLAIACASMALGSVAVAAQGLKHIALVLGDGTLLFRVAQFVVVKAAGLVTSVV